MTPPATLQIRLQASLGSASLDVDLECRDGPLVLIGPNGAGKTSLLLGVLGALPLVGGRVAVGQRLLLDSQRGIATPIEERRIGYLPQDYGLFSHLTVAQNVQFALRCAFARQSRQWLHEQALAGLASLGVLALADRLPAGLSGGERQRVALARALAAAPTALLLDEPLAALDVHTRDEVRRFLAQYLQHARLPAVVVTHDPADARALGGQIAVLEAGRVTQQGSWQQLVQAPQTPYVAAFVAGGGVGERYRAVG